MSSAQSKLVGISAKPAKAVSGASSSESKATFKKPPVVVVNDFVDDVIHLDEDLSWKKNKNHHLRGNVKHQKKK